MRMLTPRTGTDPAAAEPVLEGAEVAEATAVVGATGDGVADGLDVAGADGDGVADVAAAAAVVDVTEAPEVL